MIHYALNHRQLRTLAATFNKQLVDSVTSPQLSR